MSSLRPDGGMHFYPIGPRGRDRWLSFTVYEAIRPRHAVGQGEYDLPRPDDRSGMIFRNIFTESSGPGEDH